MNIKSVVSWFENANIPVWAWLIELFVVSGIRFYAEGFYFRYSYDNMVFIHALGYYFFIFTFAFMITKLITNEKSRKIASAFSFFTPVIIITPFVDYYYFGRTAGYPYPSTFNWAQITLSFFQKYPNAPSHGYQIEFGILFFALFIYIYSKLENRRIVEKLILSASTVFTIYVMVLYLSTPDFSYINNYFMGDIPTPWILLFKDFPYYVWFLRYSSLGIIFLLISAIAGDVRKIFHLLKDSSLLRTIHFVMMVFLGFYLIKPNLDWSVIPGRINTITIILASLSSVFGWFFIVGINNYYDWESDMITNIKRGLPSGYYTPQDLLDFSLMSLVIGFFLLLPLGFLPIFFYSVFVFLGFIYSYPPLYLKQYGVKTIFIGTGSALIFSVGYFTPVYTYLFPSLDFHFWLLFFIVLIIFSIGSIINDLKDYESDRVSGVKTVFTWLGKERGLLFSSVILLIAFSLPVLICPQGIFIFPVLAVIASYLFYREKVFWVYMVYFAEYVALILLV